MNPEGIYLHHFSIMAPEEVIERVVDFYRKILGLKPGFRPDFALPGYWLYSGNYAIIHLTANKDRSEGNPGFFHHITLHCSNIDEVIDRLNRFKISYRRNDLASIQLAQLIVRDPAGTLIELAFSK